MSTNQPIVRIGTRGSKLALTQANEVKQRLININPALSAEQIIIIPIKTTGDLSQAQNINLAKIGGKGLFLKEIEEALLQNEIDLAVHSLKDMNAVITDGLTIGAILPREDPHDAFICSQYLSIGQLPYGAIVGTSAARRKAILLNLRSDLKIVDFRGNVDTRLNKLNNKEVCATILAVAGLKRLKIANDKYKIIDSNLMLPAIAQGAIAIQTKIDNRPMIDLAKQINHQPSQIRVLAERSFLKTLEADCSTPIAALATINRQNLTLNALIAKPNGSIIKKITKTGPLDQAAQIGESAAYELLAMVDSNFFIT